MRHHSHVEATLAQLLLTPQVWDVLGDLQEADRRVTEWSWISVPVHYPTTEGPYSGFIAGQAFTWWQMTTATTPGGFTLVFAGADLLAYGTPSTPIDLTVSALRDRDLAAAGLQVPVLTSRRRGERS